VFYIKSLNKHLFCSFDRFVSFGNVVQSKQDYRGFSYCWYQTSYIAPANSPPVLVDELKTGESNIWTIDATTMELTGTYPNASIFTIVHTPLKRTMSTRTAAHQAQPLLMIPAGTRLYLSVTSTLIMPPPKIFRSHLLSVEQLFVSTHSLSFFLQTFYLAVWVLTASGCLCQECSRSSISFDSSLDTNDFLKRSCGVSSSL
jgi:hypothetical protein